MKSKLMRSTRLSVNTQFMLETQCQLWSERYTTYSMFALLFLYWENLIAHAPHVQEESNMWLLIPLLALEGGDASEFSRLWTSLGHTGETARKLGEPDNPCPSRLGRIGCVATETSAVGTPRGRRGAGALNFHLKSWTSVGYTGTLFPKWRCKRSTIILFIGIFRFCGWYQ